MTAPAPMAYERFASRSRPPAETAALLERVRRLAPVLREREPAAEQARTLPAETIADLRRAGAFKLLQPARYGGLGREFADYMVVAEELGAACPSTAWVFANLELKAWMVGMFPGEAQDDVWGGGEDALVASILRPTGRSTRVDGGWEISGTWRCVSGVDHTSWTIVGSLADPVRPGGDLVPVVHLVPARDYEIHDDWHVMGLAATGSKDIVVDRAFVPEHRTLTVAAAQSGDPPGARVHPGHPLLKVPLMSAFGFFICAPLVGAARGAVDVFHDHVTGRTTLGAATAGGRSMAHFQTVQVRLAEAGMRVDAARAVMLDAAVATVDEVLADGGVTLERRIANRRAQAFATRLAVEAVDGAFDAVGAGGLFLSERLQRMWRDVHAGAAHFGVNWDAIRVMCGEYAVGRQPGLRYY